MVQSKKRLTAKKTKKTKKKTLARECIKLEITYFDAVFFKSFQTIQSFLVILTKKGIIDQSQNTISHLLTH